MIATGAATYSTSIQTTGNLVGTITVTMTCASTQEMVFFAQGPHWTIGITPANDSFAADYTYFMWRLRKERQRQILLKARKHYTPRWRPRPTPVMKRLSQPSKCR